MNTSLDEGIGDPFNEPMISPSKITLNGVQLDQVHKYYGRKRPLFARRQLSFNELDLKRGHTAIQQSTNVLPTMHSKSHFSEESGQIFISNLHLSVTDRDLINIFSVFGKLIRSAINYESNGRSTGTAFVVYEQKKDALMAYRALNEQSLRGLILSLNYIQPIEQNSGFTELSSNITKIFNQNKVIEQNSVVDTRRRRFWSERDNTEGNEKEDNEEEEDGYDWKRFKH